MPDRTPRRTRILGADRLAPGSDLPAERAATPHVAQQGAIQTEAVRRHLRTLGPRDLARPASGGGGVLFLVLLLVVGVIAVMALAGTGNL